MDKKEAKAKAFSEAEKEQQAKISEQVDEFYSSEKQRILGLLASLADGDKRQIALAPGMHSPIRALLEAPLGELEKMVDDLVNNHPDSANALVHALTQLAEDQRRGLTKIDKRVQNPEQARERPEFKSFCKRKGDW